MEEIQRVYKTVDELTGLPSIPFIALDLKGMLETTGELGILYLNIFRYEKGAGGLDWPIWDVTLKETAEVLKDLQGVIFRKDDIVSTYKDRKNNLLIILSPPRGISRLKKEDLKRVRDRILPALRERMERRLGYYESQRFSFYMGYSILRRRTDLSTTRSLDEAVDEAHQMTIDEERHSQWEKVGELKGIIARKDIRVLFQPIVHLTSSTLLGYEALSRGPEGTGLENPDLLFYLAHRADMVLFLEEVCRERAILAAIGLKGDEKLFLNTEPEVCQREEDKDRGLLEKVGLSPEQIAIELNEKRASSSIPLFRKAAKYFRDNGFLICVDGIDSGYESLGPIIELRPDFIKIGLPLIRGIESDPSRQELIKAMKRISKDLGSILIAVGIERAEEYKALMNLGVEYGQGYHLGAPGLGSSPNRVSL